MVTQTVPTVYLDKRGVAVQGFIVYFLLPEFDEVHEVRVPNLAESTVKGEIETLYKQRKALTTMGSSK